MFTQTALDDDTTLWGGRSSNEITTSTEVVPTNPPAPDDNIPLYAFILIALAAGCIIIAVSVGIAFACRR